MKKHRRLLGYGGAILLLLILLEVTLRTVWGFGKMPLYAASSEWEYMTLLTSAERDSATSSTSTAMV